MQKKHRLFRCKITQHSISALELRMHMSITVRQKILQLVGEAADPQVEHSFSNDIGSIIRNIKFDWSHTRNHTNSSIMLFAQSSIPFHGFTWRVQMLFQEYHSIIKSLFFFLTTPITITTSYMPSTGHIVLYPSQKINKIKNLSNMKLYFYCDCGHPRFKFKKTFSPLHKPKNMLS